MVSFWRIDPAGLAALLSRASAEYELLMRWGVADEAVAIVKDLGWGSPVTGEVPAAVGDVFNRFSTQDLPLVGWCIQAGIVGVGHAARAYRLGQEQMASNFESEMKKSAQSGDFEYFKKNGYWGR